MESANLPRSMAAAVNRVTDVERLRWEQPTDELELESPRPDARDYRQQSLECDPLSRGDRVGRYAVLEPIGEGGMGVVYKAWDPKLDRTVALKVLWDGRARGVEGSLGTERFAEAQTLAKIDHPNIVPIYDAGLSQGRMFIAMALCEGQTLSRYLAQGGHPVREIISMFVAAGRGLSAAHQAGIVHRDFKPANVLVGDDGSVRVADFGMARLMELAVDDGSTAMLESTWQGPVHDQSVSTIVGTPMYMAPEQLLGRLGDHRMDQFSFCLSLYTALLEHPPFGGTTFQERRMLVPLGLGETERERLNRSRRIPARVRRAIIRGLSIDPERRFATMDELLAELAERRRWPWTASALTLAIGLGLGGLAGAESREEPCREPAVLLAGAWSDDRAESLSLAIARTGHPGAAEHDQRVRGVFDAYVDRWKRSYADACEATYVSQTQSETLFDRRVQCLVRRRSRLEAAIDALAEADSKDSLDRRLPVAFELPSIAECDDTEALTRGVSLPEEPELRRAVERLHHDIDVLDTERIAGSFEDGLGFGREVVERARALGHEPTLALALESMGRLHADASAPAEAEATLREAIQRAARSQDERLMARAWSSLVYAVALQGERPNTSELHFAAEAAVDAAEDGLARAWLFNNLGILYSERRDFERAQSYLERALRLKTELHGEHGFDVAITWTNLGFVLAFEQKWEPASRAFEQARAIFERTVGVDHPHNDLARSGLCKIAVATRRYQTASALCRSALSRLESSSASPALINRVRVLAAKALRGSERYGEALALANAARQEALVFDVALSRDIGKWIAEVEAEVAAASDGVVESDGGLDPRPPALTAEASSAEGSGPLRSSG